MDFLSVREDDKILIIAPHPDDESIGMGGLLLQYPQKCSVWVLTDGGIGQGDLETCYTKEKRHSEFVDEMECLGITDFCFLGIPDGTLIEHTDCLNDRNLSEFTKIFVTGEEDGHPDHTAAFMSVISAVRAQNITPLIYEYEVHNHMQSPTHMLDITGLMEKKKLLIRFHRSQLISFPYDSFAEITAKYRAMQNRQSNGYYEVYRILRNMNGNKIQGDYEIEIKIQKQIRFYQLLTKWMDKRNKGRSISDFFDKSTVHTVAVYGYAELGRLTVDELVAATTITVSYVIDKKAIDGKGIVDIMKPSGDNPPVDAVIVTAINSFEEIKEELGLLGYHQIISLDEVVDKI